MKKLIFIISFLFLVTQNLPAVAVNQSNKTSDDENKINAYHPIVYDGILLGGYKDSKWIKASEAVNHVKGGEKYRLYTIAKYIGEAPGGKGIPPQDSEPDAEKVTINYKAAGKENFLAVNGDWKGIPRIPLKQSNSNKTYINIVADILKAKGLKNPQVKIKQNYKIDLDGNGTDEVLICADNFKELGATKQKNTYSLIILRKIVNGKVQNILLRSEVNTKDRDFSDGCPLVFDIKNICDVNGDGDMEVLLGYRYYEGYGYELIEVGKTGHKTVLSNGIGA